MRAIENIFVDFLNNLSRREHRPKSDEIILGRNGDNIALWKVRAGHHIHTIGGSRSGKTRLLSTILRQLFLQRISCILVDFHSDLFTQALTFLHSLPDEITRNRVIVADFSRSDYLPGVNPLNLSHRALRPSALVNLILTGLRQRWQGQNNWGVRIQETIRNSIWVLLQNRLSLADLPRMLRDSTFRASLLSYVSNPEVRDFFDFFDDLSPQMRNSWISPAINRVSDFLADPIVRRVIAQPETTIPFRRIMDTPGTLALLDFAKAELQTETSQLLASVAFPAIVDAIFSRVEIPQNQRRPCVLMIDEAQLYPNELEVLLSECGKFGISVISANQHYGQMPAKIRSSILANCTNLCVFRINSDDANILVSTIAPGKERFIKPKLLNLPPRHFCFCNRESGKLEFVEAPFVKDFPVIADNRFIKENIAMGILLPVREITRANRNDRTRTDTGPRVQLQYREGQDGW